MSMRMQSQREFLTIAWEPGLMNKCAQTFPAYKAITLLQKKTQRIYDCECPLSKENLLWKISLF